MGRLENPLACSRKFVGNPRPKKYSLRRQISRTIVRSARSNKILLSRGKAKESFLLKRSCREKLGILFRFEKCLLRLEANR